MIFLVLLSVAKVEIEMDILLVQKVGIMVEVLLVEIMILIFHRAAEQHM
jgi:hypothetical protein